MKKNINKNFTKISLELTKTLNNDEKKNYGIYFTPQNIIKNNIELLKHYINNSTNILEPSCGSCEYIKIINNLYSNINITGIELNETIYNSIKNLENDKIKLYNENFLDHKENIKYDIIIGNPPFNVISKTIVKKEYHKYFEGRPNIFILFIIKSLRLLNKDGILSFILPKNFTNCLYYDKTRKYIIKNYSIINIIEYNEKFIDTKQEIILIIIQNNSINNENDKYVLEKDGYTIFGTIENINNLKQLYLNSTTLNKLNLKVNVGNIVWNQNKSILTNDNTKTLLIYSSDIKNNILNIQKYSNKDKKNYIDKIGKKDTILVINRGYGVGKYKFEYCLIDMEKEYLIENHLICIESNNKLDKIFLQELFNKIMRSFDNENTSKFIKLYFGNNAINTTELCKILPIYGI